MTSKSSQTSTEPLPFTYEDYCQLPDDGKRYEILEGDLVAIPSPPRKHQKALLNLAIALFSFTQTNRLGEVYHGPLDVVLSEYTVVQPDILFISNRRLSILTEENVQGAPDLVIEILSPATRERDLGLKKKIYARFGVKEYWIVDPEGETVEVIPLHAADFKLHQLFQGDDVLRSFLLPGLEIPLPSIFR